MLCKLNNKGFTLVETLAAVMVVVLLVAMIAAGLPAATQVYRKTTFASESEILGASLNTELSNILRYATAGIDDKGTPDTGDDIIRFTNKSYLAQDAYFLVDDYIIIHEDAIEDTQDASDVFIVNRGTYTNMVIKDFAITYNATTHIFSGGYTIQVKDDPALSKEVAFSYKSLV